MIENIYLEVVKMKTGLKWLVGCLVVMGFLGGRQAEATTVLLSDYPSPSEYFSSVATNHGGAYKVDLSYWVETDNSEALSAATSHDIFYFAFLSSTSDFSTSTDLFSGNYSTLFDNGATVDIMAIIPQSNPTILTQTVIGDSFLFPYFLVDNGNSDFSATVHIDYSIAQLETTPVPEPSTMLLIGAGLLGLTGLARKRR